MIPIGGGEDGGRDEEKALGLGVAFAACPRRPFGILGFLLGRAGITTLSSADGTSSSWTGMTGEMPTAFWQPS